MLEQALELLGPADSVDRARLMAQLGTELVFAGNWASRADLSGQAVAMARRLGDPATLMHVLNLRIVTLWGAPTMRERGEMAAEARALADQVGDPVPAFYANCYGAHAAWEAGDAATARALTAATAALAAGLGQPILSWYAAMCSAKLALVTAPLAESEALVMESLAAGQEAGQPDAMLWAAAQLNVVRVQQGRAAEIVALIEGAYQAQPFAGSVPMLARAGLAMLYCETGRLDEARSMLEAVTAAGFEDMPCDFGWLAAVAIAAEAAWKLGGCERAEAIHDRLAPYRDQFVDMGPGWLGSVAYYLALAAAVLGRTEEADGAFAQAAEAHTHIGARPWLVTTQVAWAAHLVRSATTERVVQARTLLGEALASARQLGLVVMERQASQQLAELAPISGH